MSAQLSGALRLVPSRAERPAEPATSRQAQLRERGQSIRRVLDQLAQDVGQAATAVIAFQAELADYAEQIERETLPVNRRSRTPQPEGERRRFGQLLRDLRMRAGMSRALLAKRTRIGGGPGLSEDLIKLLENGKGTVTRRSVLLLLKVQALGLTVEDVALFLGGPQEGDAGAERSDDAAH